MTKRGWLVGLALLAASVNPLRGDAAVRSSLGDISGIAVAQASTSTSVSGVVSRRFEKERLVEDSNWVIIPHRPNYILPFTWSLNPNEGPAEEALGEDVELDNAEVKFQISFKLPVWRNILDSKANLFFAYTQISLWQMYNWDDSAPFRDTNYEPEGAIVVPTDYDFLGFKMRTAGFGFVHQSNGRGSEALSRSWNRLYGLLLFERGNFAWSIKPWWRVPEDEEDDNNPNIEKYLGYGELRAAYVLGDHVFALMLRDNLRLPDNKGAIQLDWSFPLYGRLKAYLQYFGGYGESLLDYDHENHRIGIGVLMSDWL